MNTEPVPGTGFTARYRFASARLSGAQKSAVAVPAYLRYVNRRAGGWFAAAAYALGLTPTQVTVASCAASTVSLLGLAVAPATVAVGFVVALGLLVAYALDSADGQLARIRGGGTLSGEWLDHVLDVFKLALLHSCVLISMYRNFSLGHRAVLLVPVSYLVAQTTGFFANMLRDQLRSRTGAPSQPPSQRSSLAASLALLPFDHAAACFVFVTLGWHLTFLWTYGLLCLAGTAFAVRALIRGYVNLRSIDSAAARERATTGPPARGR